MLPMRFSEAEKTVLEPTETGYSLRSLDKLWVIVVVNDWSSQGSEPGDDYSTVGMFGYLGKMPSRDKTEGFYITYDWGEDNILVFTRVAAARRYIKGQKFESDGWYVLNLGDSIRESESRLPGFPKRSPKFASSWPALKRKLDVMATRHG